MNSPMPSLFYPPCSNRYLVFSRHWQALLLLCGIALIIGCESSRSQPDVEPTSQPPSPSWKTLVKAVREQETSELVFTAEPISRAQAEDLREGCEALMTLEINQSQLDLETLETVLKALPQLQRLKLTGDVDGEKLRVITEHAPSLTLLNLPEGSFDDTAMKHLATMASLELLRFHSPHVTDAGMETISQLPNLRFLHLINVPMTDAGLKPLYEMEQLESFYLDGSECTEDGLSELIKARPDLHFHWNQLHLKTDPHRHPH